MVGGRRRRGAARARRGRGGAGRGAGRARGGRRAARARGRAGGRAAHILLLHHGELVDAVLRHDVVRVRAREPRALEEVGDLGLRNRLAVEEVVVLLDADHAAEHHLVLLEREALVAVVEVHLDVRRDHVRAAPLVEQLLPLLLREPRVAPAARHVAEDELDRREEVRLAGAVGADCGARGGAGGERRARARRARTRARGAMRTDDVVLRTEGLRLDAVAVALEALDDHAFDVHVAWITRKIDPAGGLSRGFRFPAAGEWSRASARAEYLRESTVLLRLLPDATAGCAILRSPAQF